MLRPFIFFLGCFLMFLSLLVPFVPSRPEWFGQSWVFSLGLALAVASHGFPEGVL